MSVYASLGSYYEVIPIWSFTVFTAQADTDARNLEKPSSFDCKREKGEIIIAS